MTIPPNSGLEVAMKNYLQSVNIPSVGSAVYRHTDMVSDVAPLGVFVISARSKEKELNSGIFSIPFAISINMAAADIATNTGSLDSTAAYVFNSLSGSQTYINANSNDIYIFSMTQPSMWIEPALDQFVYGIEFEAVCKAR